MKIAFVCGLAGRNCWVARLNSLSAHEYSSFLLPDIISEKGTLISSFIDDLHKYDVIVLHSMSSYLLSFSELHKFCPILFDPNLDVADQSLISNIERIDTDTYKQKILQNIFVNSPCVCGKCRKKINSRELACYMILAKKICEEQFSSVMSDAISKNKLRILRSRDGQIPSSFENTITDTGLNHNAMLDNPLRFEKQLEKLLTT
ncbi:hypothetical protein OAB03_01265 [Planktomarina temperata]|nr:hypothetical protein [Planktomarina temperata]